MRCIKNLSFALLAVASALPGARGGDVNAGNAFLLPPFVVYGNDLSGPRWRHYEDESLDLLSACDEDDTVDFIRVLEERRIELSQFIPPKFLFHTKLPTTIILFPRSLKGTMERDVFSILRRLPKAVAAKDRFRPMSDLRLADPDSVYLFVFLNGRNADGLSSLPSMYQDMEAEGALDFVYSPSYLQFLLRMRAPALPEWFVSGIAGFYGSMNHAWEKDGFKPDPWLSAPGSEAQNFDSSSPRPILPMNELLEARFPGSRSVAYQRVWKAQAELFVRWALSDQISDGRARLWKFAAMSAARPVSELQFEECFGLNFADARDALSDYLSLATTADVKGPPGVGKLPKVPVLRDASSAEICRIEGEWARRSLTLVKSIYPSGVSVYAKEANRLLKDSFDQGERDPRLIASLALLQIESGDVAGGRRLIDAHPEACEARPLAGLEFAQFQLSDALEKPNGPAGKLSEAQAARILDLMKATFRQEVPMESSYLLEVRALEHIAREPNTDELEFVDDGAREFPRNVPMLVKVASWMLRSGRTVEARSLVELGLWECTDPVARDELALLANYTQPDGHLSN